MSLKRKILKGSAVLTAGSMAGKTLALVRNIILARILAPDDFGIAATFIITLALLQSISEVAADKLLVQAKDGDDERLQKVMHIFQLLRGVLSASILIIFAQPIAGLFGAPETAWAFRTIAVIPVLRGMAHLDMRRVQRRMHYTPFVLVDLISQFAAVLVAAPIALWLKDYRAALWILLFQTLIFTACTHIFAERRWGAAFDRRYLNRLVGFGWPLMINGFLMFLIVQGDRLVIGSDFSPYTLADLGVYSVAITLLMTPRDMFARVTNAIFLPLLSSLQDDRPAFTSRYRLCLQFSTLFATMTGVVFITVGPLIVTLLYGEKYSGASVFLAWLAASQTARIIRTLPATAGLARADSRQLMYTNIARAASILILVPVAWAGLSLAWIAAGGLVGEIIALMTGVILLRLKHGLVVSATACPALASALSLALAAGAVEFINQDDWLETGIVTIGAALASLAILAAPFRELRELFVQDGLHAVRRLRQMARNGKPATVALPD